MVWKIKFNLIRKNLAVLTEIWTFMMIFEALVNELVIELYDRSSQLNFRVWKTV